MMNLGKKINLRCNNVRVIFHVRTYDGPELFNVLHFGGFK